MLVDVGLTWRVTPEVSEGRASRTTVTSQGEHPLVGSHDRKAVEGNRKKGTEQSIVSSS